MSKYIITCWASYYDYDGLYNGFKILGEYQEKSLAISAFELLSDAVVQQEVEKEARDNNRKFIEFEAPDYKKPGGTASQFYSKPNCNNRVTHGILRAIYDEALPDYNKNYYSIEIVEFPEETEITPELFNLEECKFEVEAWFKERKSL